uniref:Methyltransferase small domain-containing protein n=2 Tax=Arion vulgaris TaxID=1028688 RepID=A0A0B7A2E0_9EUPU
MFINHKVTGGRLSAYSYCILILIYSDTFVSSDVSEPTTLSSEADSRQSYCSRDASIDACPVTNKYKTEEEDKLNVGSIEDKPGKMTSLAVVPYDETNLPLHKMSVRHFSIAGNNFTIHQNFLGLGVSAFVWDSAVVLAKYLAKNRHLVHGKKVIELGAGTGLTGLVAAALGKHSFLVLYFCMIHYMCE